MAQQDRGFGERVGSVWGLLIASCAAGADPACKGAQSVCLRCRDHHQRCGRCVPGLNVTTKDAAGVCVVEIITKDAAGASLVLMQARKVVSATGGRTDGRGGTGRDGTDGRMSTFSVGAMSTFSVLVSMLGWLGHYRHVLGVIFDVLGPRF